MAKGKNKLKAITIRRATNGGHHVRHEFEPQASMKKGAMSGGLMMDRPADEEHTFGSGDHKNLLAHIMGALSLKGGGEEE